MMDDRGIKLSGSNGFAQLAAGLTGALWLLDLIRGALREQSRHTLSGNIRPSSYGSFGGERDSFILGYRCYRHVGLLSRKQLWLFARAAVRAPSLEKNPLAAAHPSQDQTFGAFFQKVRAP